MTSLAIARARSNDGSANMSRGPISLPSVIWKPRPTTRGGPSKRLGCASPSATGISGAWCEPRMQPATVCGNENGSSTSPTAGRPDCERTISTGSSLPT